MPNYSYACTECGHAFDIYQAFSDDALTTCPQCQGALRKKFSAVGVVFKGSGFYRNDARSGSNSKSGKDSGSKDSGSTDSGSQSAAGSDGDGSAKKESSSSGSSGSSGSSDSGSGNKSSGGSGGSTNGTTTKAPAKAGASS